MQYNSEDDEIERKMCEEKKEKQRYFNEALSDFTHDVASGRAIRHLADLGYTTQQIMERLDYPTPRPRVEQTVYRHYKETGVILDQLPYPEQEMQLCVLKRASLRKLYRELRCRIESNGAENSFVSCPFGTIYRDRETRLQKMLAPLTGRERDYILGIPWEMQVVYHQLTGRMLEISVQLALCSETEFRFYFLKTKEILELRDRI